MSYQGLYPSLDQPKEFQPYPPVYNTHTHTATPQGYAYQNTPVNNELNEPLVQSSQPEKKVDPQLYTKISVLVIIVCFLIEFSAIAYTLFYTYLFEYCYWEFGLIRYSKSADQTLVAADSHGKTKKFYKDLECKDKNNFPECPDLCHLAGGLKKSGLWVIWGSGISGAITLAVILLLIISLFRNKQILNCISAGILLMSSYIVFIGAGVIYLVQSHLLEDFDDPKEFNQKGIDDPNELDTEDGAKLMAWILVFMLVYRLALIYLAKSRS